MPESIDAFTSISSIPSQPQVLISDSSSILGYSYDATNYILDVFYKNTKGNESIYRYFYCYPSTVSAIFDTAGSYGAKAKLNLKGLQYQKLK